MASYYCITMPDQSIWAIPVSVIAENRAKHYAHEFGNDLQRSLDEDTLPFFESDEYAIEDWAKNNMDWADVKEFAIRLLTDPPPSIDFEDGWVHGETSYCDLAADIDPQFVKSLQDCALREIHGTWDESEHSNSTLTVEHFKSADHSEVTDSEVTKIDDLDIDDLDNEPKRMDIKEFRARGYLQEVNRQFLHPLGLAMEVIIEADGTERLGGVWDYRDDPEGVCFVGMDVESFRAKADTICREHEEKAVLRKKILGHVIQPVDTVSVIGEPLTEDVNES